jgi:tetratricopeptide (TPR) repeat protein
MMRRNVEPVLWFLITASVFLIGIVFVSDVSLGAWEWSFSCVAAIAYNCTAIYAFVSSREQSEPSPDGTYALVLMIAFNLFNAFPWLALNASEKSINRTEQLALHDPGSFHVTASSPLLELTLYCYQNGKKDQALKFATRAIAELPQDPRSYSNMAILMINLGRLEQAGKILRGVIERFPSFAPAYKDLIGLSERRGDHATTYLAVEKMYGLYLRNRRPFIASMGKDQLLSYFSFFEKVERGELKNIARADSILHQMQLLQQKD